MKIGIDVSQLAYENTGVANYLGNLVQHLLENDRENEYILFFSSLRRKFLISNFPYFAKASQGKQFLIKSQGQNVKIKTFKIPPTVLSFLWNDLHVVPIETFIGDVDIFITSDWAEPPAKHAKKISIIYDLIVYKYPEETHNQTEFNPKTMRISANIVQTGHPYFMASKTGNPNPS